MLTLMLILGAYVILGMFMDAIGMLLLTLACYLPCRHRSKWWSRCHSG